MLGVVACALGEAASPLGAAACVAGAFGAADGFVAGELGAFVGFCVVGAGFDVAGAVGFFVGALECVGFCVGRGFCVALRVGRLVCGALRRGSGARVWVAAGGGTVTVLRVVGTRLCDGIDVEEAELEDDDDDDVLFELDDELCDGLTASRALCESCVDVDGEDELLESVPLVKSLANIADPIKANAPRTDAPTTQPKARRRERSASS